MILDGAKKSSPYSPLGDYATYANCASDSDTVANNWHGFDHLSSICFVAAERVKETRCPLIVIASHPSTSGATASGT